VKLSIVSVTELPEGIVPVPLPVLAVPVVVSEPPVPRAVVPVQALRPRRRSVAERNLVSMGVLSRCPAA